MVKALHKKWEKLTVVRTRFRKSKPWLKLKLNSDKKGKETDIILDTEALKENTFVLIETLQHYGLVLQPIPEMTEEAFSVEIKLKKSSI